MLNCAESYVNMFRIHNVILISYLQTEYFVQDGRPSCRPTNSIKALKTLNIQSTEYKSNGFQTLNQYENKPQVLSADHNQVIRVPLHLRWMLIPVQKIQVTQHNIT